MLPRRQTGGLLLFFSSALCWTRCVCSWVVMRVARVTGSDRSRRNVLLIPKRKKEKNARPLINNISAYASGTPWEAGWFMGLRVFQLRQTAERRGKTHLAEIRRPRATMITGSSWLDVNWGLRCEWPWRFFFSTFWNFSPGGSVFLRHENRLEKKNWKEEVAAMFYVQALPALLEKEVGSLVLISIPSSPSN